MSNISSLELMRDELIEQVQADAKEDWETALERHIEEWNKTHASVIVGGKHRIMRFEPASASHTGRESYTFYGREELSKVYDNRLIKIGEKELKDSVKDIYANYVMAWAKDYRSRSYPGGVVFLPNKKPPKDYYNTWQGFSVEPLKNDALLERIFYHMESVVCAGNKDLYEYMIKWIAYTTQNPDKPAGAALVLRGEKGSGKGTIGRFLCNIWGNHAAHISNPKHLVGNFNGHLTDVCFMFADEAFFSGDKAHEGVLKALITEPTLMIERKGIDAQQQPNYLKIFMATNSDFAVPASRDERRYCVYDVSSKHIGDREYFKALNADCSSKAVQSAFLHYMHDIDLTGWYTGMIPDSAGLREQRYHSMNTVQKWLVQALMDEDFGIHPYTAWQKELTTKELYGSYLEFCNNGKASEYHILSETQLARYFRKVFEPLKRIGSGNNRGFFLGDIESAISSFEQYEKVSIEELTPYFKEKCPE